MTLLLLCVCVLCVCVWYVCACEMMASYSKYVEEKGNFVELVHSFNLYEGSRNSVRVVRLIQQSHFPPWTLWSTWIYLEHVLLNKRSHFAKSTDCLIPIIQFSETATEAWEWKLIKQLVGHLERLDRSHGLAMVEHSTEQLWAFLKTLQLTSTVGLQDANTNIL